MKKVLVLGVFLLSACSETNLNDKLMTTSVSQSKELEVEISVSENNHEFMKKTIEKVHGLVAEDETVLPLNQVIIDESKSEIFCGNTTAFEIFVMTEGVYNAVLTKEANGGLSVQLSFNQQGQLIAVYMTTSEKEQVVALLEVLEFPLFAELKLSSIGEEGVFARYKKDKTYVNYQGVSVDEDGMGQSCSYSLSYYANVEMKSEYQLSEEFLMEKLEDYQGL
ncbi:hypothetical protein [uncultured Vagococcus sp.]|uniref:hypothetical protein n=1 Tax=uncultured Vagococcus sp. TaxID=189676 RepID=UPI0028D257CF|nr:hypothetical protein [uncultured Vagococcus sp.]